MRTSFHGFELDVQQGRLLRDEREITLEPRTYSLLRYLVENPDRLVTKAELKKEVWRTQGAPR